MVDVYSDWSGPCSAMTSFLKKVKLEVNDDLVQLNIPTKKIIKRIICFFMCEVVLRDGQDRPYPPAKGLPGTVQAGLAIHRVR